jgi:hypothetical protein
MKNILLLLLLTLGLTLLWAEQDYDDLPPLGGTGTVVINTDPPGSKVFLDGEEIGKTPLTKKFRSGRWTLIVMDQEHQLVKTRMNVWPDSVNTFDSDTKMPYGNIQITTKPGKCDIYVDGEWAEGTDGSYLTIRNLDAGDHLIKATCGRLSKDTIVTVPNEETLELFLDVTKR